MKAATYEEAQDSRESKGMFWLLLRQDAVRRSLRWSVPFAAVVGLLIRISMQDAFRGWEDLPFHVHCPEQITLFVQLWLGVLFAVIIAHFNSRCPSLGLSLPISPRTLWLARVVAVAGAAVIPIAILIASTAVAEPTARIGLDSPLWPIGVRAAAGFILAVVLFQLPSPGVHRIAGNKFYVFYVGAVSAAIIVYSIMTPGSWLFTAAPIVSAVAIGWLVVRRSPAAFDLAGGKPRRDSRPPLSNASQASGRSLRSLVVTTHRRGRLGRRWKLLRVIWRENLNAWPVWVMTLLLFVTVWSRTSAYYKGYTPLYEYTSLLLWCWIMLSQSVRRLTRLDYVPVRRSVVFYSVILFMALPIGLGFLTGYLLDYRLASVPPTQVSLRNHTVHVPFEAWEIANNGVVPEVSSPWGETYTPCSTRLVGKWSNIAVYNPYEPGKRSSPQFVALQIDRAVARVHSPDEVSPRASDLAGDSSFAMAIRDGEYTVEASIRRNSDMRIRTNAIVIMVWFLLLVVVNGVWWRRFRPEADVVRTRWFAILFFGIPYVLMIGLIVLSVRGVLNDWAILAIQMVILRTLVEAIPLHTGILLGMTVVVGTACLFVLGKLYAKAEAPAPRSGKHLLSEY